MLRARKVRTEISRIALGNSGQFVPQIREGQEAEQQQGA